MSVWPGTAAKRKTSEEQNHDENEFPVLRGEKPEIWNEGAPGHRALTSKRADWHPGHSQTSFSKAFQITLNQTR